MWKYLKEKALFFTWSPGPGVFHDFFFLFDLVEFLYKPWTMLLAFWSRDVRSSECVSADCYLKPRLHVCSYPQTPTTNQPFVSSPSVHARATCKAFSSAQAHSAGALVCISLCYPGKKAKTYTPIAVPASRPSAVLRQEMDDVIPLWPCQLC